MYKVAVMGDYDSIYGFAALGLTTFPVETAEEGAAQLKKAAADDFAVVYMTEALAASLQEEIEVYRDQLRPAVILITGVSGNTGAGIAQVKKSVEQAVGSDIIFNGEN